MLAYFMANPEALGYEGDINDTSALRSWAENQVANAIERTGDVKDLIHEGNIISLDKDDAGEIIIDIEKGDGLEPGYLPVEEVESVDIKEDELIREKDIPEKLESLPGFVESERPSVSGLEGGEEDLPKEGTEPEPEPKPETEPESEKDLPEEESKPIEGSENEKVSDYNKMLDSLNNIGKEGGLKSDSESAYNKWAESIDVGESDLGTEEPSIEDDVESPDKPDDKIKDVQEELPSLKEQSIEDIVSKKEKQDVSIENVLNQISEKNEADLTTQDKLISEFVKQNNIAPDSDLRALLQENPFLAMHESPIAQELLNFHELRQATGEEKIDLLHKIIDKRLGNLSTEQLDILNSLKEKGAFDFVISDDSSDLKAFVFQLGEKKSEFDFSRKGLNQLSSLVKKLILEQSN